MSVSEPERHELYQAFEGLMGKKKAETMMALLPPTGWGDVATRRDLNAIDQRFEAIDRRFDAVHRELDAIKRELDQKTDKRDLAALESRVNAQIMRTALTVNIPAILAAFGLSFAATHLG